MEHKTLAGQFEVKFADGQSDQGTLAGYGSVFSNSDSYGDIVAPGAFTKSLAEHKAAGTMPAMLLNHNMMSLPIGVWNTMEEDSTGLKCSGHFIDTTMGADAYKAAKAGAITGLSIGFIVTGYEMSGNSRVITEVKLVEVSLVVVPANDLAQISDVKTNQENEVKTEEFKALHAMLVELKADIAKITVKSMDDDSDEDCDCEDDDDCECDGEEEKSEAKYNEKATRALETLVLKLKQEKDVR